jgi:hypothetical protein
MVEAPQGQRTATEQLVITVETPVGRIVKIERVDESGAHQELSEEELAKLAGEDEVGELDAALEEAFETGAAAALGEDDEDEDNEGTMVRRRLRHRLLTRLLLRRLIRRRLLERRLQGVT